MIISNDLFIDIKRFKGSHYFKFDKNKNDFENNINNNMLDIFRLFYKNISVFQCSCQTIANHPKYDYLDSLAEGNFQVKCFVPPNDYHGEIHAIINTKNLAGKIINKNSYQAGNGELKGCWLICDNVWKGRRLVYAYSKSSIIMYPENLEMFNSKLKKYGINGNYIIRGKIEEI